MATPLKVVLFTGEVGISGAGDGDDFAGTRTSRLFALCEGQIPECLLPIANRTVLSYQLELFEEVGLSDVIIVTHDWCVDKLKMHTQSCKNLNIDIVAVPQYFCAVDTLLHLRPKLKSDFIVLNWDVIIEPRLLHKMVDLHRLKAATMTALFLEREREVDDNSKGKGKGKSQGKPKQEAFLFDSLKLPSRSFTPRVHHFVGLDDNRLLMCTPTTPLGAMENEVLDKLIISKSLLRAYPRITLHANNSVEDCTFYICSTKLLTFIDENEEDLTSRSIQRDLLPMLVKRQFSKKYDGKAEEGEGEESAVDETDRLIQDMMNKKPRDRTKCFAFVIGKGAQRQQGYIGRVQSLQTFASVNRDVVEGRSPFSPSEQFVENGKSYLGQGTIVENKAQVAAQSVVGSGTTVGAGAMVMKSVIGRGCVIGPGVKVTNSIIMDNVKVEGTNVRINNTILCSNVEVTNASVSQCVVGHSVKVSENLSEQVVLED